MEQNRSVFLTYDTKSRITEDNKSNFLNWLLWNGKGKTMHELHYFGETEFLEDSYIEQCADHVYIYKMFKDWIDQNRRLVDKEEKRYNGLLKRLTIHNKLPIDLLKIISEYGCYIRRSTRS